MANDRSMSSETGEIRREDPRFSSVALDWILCCCARSWFAGRSSQLPARRTQLAAPSSPRCPLEPVYLGLMMQSGGQFGQQWPAHKMDSVAWLELAEIKMIASVRVGYSTRLAIRLFCLQASLSVSLSLSLRAASVFCLPRASRSAIVALLKSEAPSEQPEERESPKVAACVSLVALGGGRRRAASDELPEPAEKPIHFSLL